MIAYELPTGKTVFLTFEDWLNLTPEKIQDLIADDMGMEIDNPFDKVVDKVKDNKDDWKNLDIPDDDEIKKIENGE